MRQRATRRFDSPGSRTECLAEDMLGARVGLDASLAEVRIGDPISHWRGQRVHDGATTREVGEPCGLALVRRVARFEACTVTERDVCAIDRERAAMGSRCVGSKGGSEDGDDGAEVSMQSAAVARRVACEPRVSDAHRAATYLDRATGHDRVDAPVAVERAPFDGERSAVVHAHGAGEIRGEGARLDTHLPS
jgi:hypothetical protein